MERDSLDKTGTEPIIRVEDFHAAYEGKTVLREVSFDIYPGEVFIVAGGSGCGKSTVLKHMIGLYEPAGGRMLIRGVDIHAAGEQELEQLRRSFGVSYQSGALFGSMTVLENVKLPMEEYTDLSKEMMDMIGLCKLRLVNLEQAADGNVTAQDMFLKPYDVVYVPRTWISDVNLFVEQYVRRMIAPFTFYIEGWKAFNMKEVHILRRTALHARAAAEAGLAGWRGDVVVCGRREYVEWDGTGEYT